MKKVNRTLLVIALFALGYAAYLHIDREAMSRELQSLQRQLNQSAR